ncbi:MAG: chorismate synthase [Cuniculiplasma sp.]
MSFVFRDRISITIFGSSHGDGIGCVVDGIPAGFSMDQNKIMTWMMRRSPGQSSLTTQRKETDKIEFVSGLTRGITDGGSITMLIRNENTIGKHYDDLFERPRPGHGDLSLFLKYGPYRNYEGGGFLSGRMTAPLVAAGALALQVLEETGMEISSYLQSMGGIAMETDRFFDDDEIYSNESRIPDHSKDMEAKSYIRELQSQGDSVGGIIKTRVRNVPEAMGEPFFDSVESIISHLIFSVPGVKGLEFGDGFKLSKMKGTESNDSFHMNGKRIRTRSNHNGGVLGGITFGNDLEFRTAMKATSSVRKEQDTVNLGTGEDDKIRVQGRHDPCIAIRAVPVIKCVTAIGLLDLYLRRQSSYKGNLKNDSSYGKNEGYEKS